MAINFAIQILEPLYDITADEYSVAVFECSFQSRKKLTATWFRDGVCIQPSKREKTYARKQNFRLEISPVSIYDYGLYNILCSDGTNQIYLKAGLYVRPIFQTTNNSGYLYEDQLLKEFVLIRRHLRSVRVNSGERIEFKVQLQTQSAKEFVWYKSNRLISQDNRIIIESDQGSSSLLISYAEMTDSGLYHVVVKTNGSYASSFAQAIVINTKYREPEDAVEKDFEEESDAYVRQILRLKCRVKMNLNTQIYCLKNGFIINENHFIKEKIDFEDYGNGHVGLKIANEGKKDLSEYSLLFKHGPDRINTTNSLVTFEDLPMTLPPVRLVHDLDSVVAYFGARVLLKCSFDVTKSEFYYVVWHVGSYKITRTSTRFNVINNGDDCYLVIKRLEPDMAGLVICELHRYVLGHKSVVAYSTTTMVTAVPPAYFHKQLNNQSISYRNVYYIALADVPPRVRSTGIEALNIEIHNTNKKSKNCWKGVPRCERKEYQVMEIDYCRLDDDVFCYLNYAKEYDRICRSTLLLVERVVGKIDKKGLDHDYPRKINVSWLSSQVNVWYTIEYLQDDGNFIQIGQSSRPMFEVLNPPLEKIMRFRIKTKEPDVHDKESNVCLLPPPVYAPVIPGKIVMKPWTEFRINYFVAQKTIGTGAFGKVVLVKNNTTGHDFAAKIIATKDSRRRKAVAKEFEVLSRLKHPNLVELLGAYQKKDSCIFIMKFFYGGQLFDRIIEKPITESDMVIYMRQICKALEYIHSKNIVHLDVKPENIVCVHPNSSHIKLVDFGLARILEEKKIAKTIYGTRDYIAPEIIKKECITFACDMWSLGIVTYLLLSGIMPFDGISWSRRSSLIVRTAHKFNTPVFKDISVLAMNFIDNLLYKNPNKRMTATSALNHKWLKNGPPKGANNIYLIRSRENLKAFLAYYRGRWQPDDCQYTDEMLEAGTAIEFYKKRLNLILYVVCGLITCCLLALLIFHYLS